MNWRNISFIFIILFLFSPSVGSAGNDEKDILDQINSASGSVVVLRPGLYTLNGHGTLTIPEGKIITGELNGDGNPKVMIELGPKLTLKQQEPVITLTKNNKISNIYFRGNSENRPTVPTWKGNSGKEKPKKTGNGYDNIIGGTGLENCEVHDCIFEDNNGDFFRPISSKNIKFYRNRGYKCGHDAFFAIRSENILAYDNYIEPRVNAAFRFMDVNYGQIYNNTVVLKPGGAYAGPSIQIQNDKGRMENIKVYGNVVRNSCGPDIWLVGKPGAGPQNIDIFLNVFYDGGWNTGIHWTGGVIASGYDNAVIRDNVWDGAHLAAITFWPYNRAWALPATAILENNIFTNSIPCIYDKQGGWGVNNEINQQQVILKGNCFYRNKAGNTNGCKVSDSDVFEDPKNNNVPCKIKWDGDKWKIPGYNPVDFGDIDFGAYKDMKPISPEEEAEFEWDNYFLNGIMKEEFLEDAVTDQEADDFNYQFSEKEMKEEGKVSMGVKLLGWNNLSKIGDQFFISDYQTDAIIASEVIQNPSLTYWTGGISKIKKKFNVSVEDNTSIVTMTAKVYWYDKKKDSKGNFKTSKIKESEYSISDKEAWAPLILEVPDKLKGIVYQYPNHYELKVFPDNYTTNIEYRINGNVSKHVYLVGVTNKTDIGVKYTEYSNLEHWEDVKGTVNRQGSWIRDNGVYDPKNVKVIVHGPYKECPVEFEIIEKEIPGGDIIKGWFYPTILFMIIFTIYCRFMLRKIFSV